MFKKTLFLCTLIYASSGLAQLFNPEVLEKNTVPVEKMQDDVLLVKQNALFRVGEMVVIVRIQGDDVEVVAKGSVANVQGGYFLILTTRKDIIKNPKVGDRIVSVSQLSGIESETPTNPQPPPIALAEPDPYEPGYADLDLGPATGDLRSQSPNQANQYKIFSFNFYDIHLLWFFDFLWRVGIEYQNTGGEVPLRSYDRQVRPTQYTETILGLHYRFLPFWKELRSSIKLVTKSNDFSTTNNDEYVLSTTGSGIGLGFNLHYLMGSDVFKSEKSFDANLNRIYTDLVFFPDFNYNDGLVKRGEMGKGVEIEAKIGAIALFHIQPMPFFKRFSLDISSGVKQSQIAFTGAPKNAPDGFYAIPAQATYEQHESYVKIMIGLRMEDFVAKSLRSR